MDNLRYEVTALCFYKNPDGPRTEADGIQAYFGVERTWKMNMDGIEPATIQEDPDCDSIVDKGLDEAIALEVCANETAPEMVWHHISIGCEHCIIQNAKLISPIVGEIVDKISNMLFISPEFIAMHGENDDDAAHDLAQDIVETVIDCWEKER